MVSVALGVGVGIGELLSDFNDICLRLTYETA